MSELSYGFERAFEGATFEDAVQTVTEGLRNEGFGVLTEIDVKSALKRKLDVDFRRYIILGACNPSLARQALEVDAHIGLLLPCNAVVQEDATGGVVVSIVDPRAMFQLTESRMLQPIAEEIDARLRRVAQSLSRAACQTASVPSERTGEPSPSR